MAAALLMIGFTLDADATQIEYYATVAEPPCELTYVPSGLGYCDILPGSGPKAPYNELINVHYTVRFADEIVFDSSYKRGRPLTMRIGAGKVIKGLDQGIFRGGGVPPMQFGIFLLSLFQCSCMCCYDELQLSFWLQMNRWEMQAPNPSRVSIPGKLNFVAKAALTAPLLLLLRSSISNLRFSGNSSITLWALTTSHPTPISTLQLSVWFSVVLDHSHISYCFLQLCALTFFMEARWRSEVSNDT
ncbi:hypothetical protein Cgig2_024120 [Carnegiea gigantea]|uniref:peptidylprolyl isomerase n=1 Tax=Carnegiea gigantea TaxID=171969 RepID=A0A9Q1GZN9_9CARY|nr:hypothetical protein Cgig2_024120 [Carnegiea gigantea]